MKTETTDVGRMGLLGERQKLAYTLRKEGMKFKEIGERMCISVNRARQLYSFAEYLLNREPHWDDGLSVRAANCMNNLNIHSREDALKAYQSGILRVGKRSPRNYGWKSHKEVAKFLGLPEPTKKPYKIYHPKFCPHCGHKVA